MPDTLNAHIDSIKAPEVNAETRRKVALYVAQLVIDNEIGIIDGTWPQSDEEQLRWWLDLLGLNDRTIQTTYPGHKPRRRKTSLAYVQSPSSDS